jgi:hypothetical protein
VGEIQDFYVIESFRHFLPQYKHSIFKSIVIASAAKQSFKDCFGAKRLAMTRKRDSCFVTARLYALWVSQ